MHIIFLSETAEKRTFGSPRHKWEDSIKLDLKEVEYDVNWIHVAHEKDQ
jgi:hypothetical protein